MLLHYRGTTYRLYKSIYVAGGTIAVTAAPKDTYKEFPVTIKVPGQTHLLKDQNWGFINTPLFGFGIIGALNAKDAGYDTGLAVFDEDGNEIPIYAFSKKFLEKLY